MVPTLLASAGIIERTSSGGGLPTRSNVKWSIGGRRIADPEASALRRLKQGDYAIYQPGGTKTDHDATTFDNPVYLPFESSPLNAANAIANMELGLPIRDARRRQTPLFAIDASGTSLDQVIADDIFKQLATLALGSDVAGTLSLHSGRVWLANAMHAIKAPPTTIQRYVRWRSIDSVLTYLRISAEEYTATISRASAADISNVDVNQLPNFDWLDDRFGDITDTDAGNDARDDDNSDTTARHTEPPPVPKRKGPALHVPSPSKAPRAPTTQSEANDARNRPTAMTTARAGPSNSTFPLHRATTLSRPTDAPTRPVNTDAEQRRTTPDKWGTASMTPIPASRLLNATPDATATLPNVRAATIMYDIHGVERWYHCTITKNNAIWLQIRLQSGKLASVTREKLRFLK